MIARVFLMVLLILSSAGSVLADGIYLIKISNEDQLATVKSRLDYAHGTMDGYFIVQADDNTYQSLLNSGIEIEKAIENRDISGIQLVEPEAPVTFLKSSNLTFDFERDGLYLASLNDESIVTARRAGYMVLPLGDLQTPFFYNPVLPFPQLKK